MNSDRKTIAYNEGWQAKNRAEYGARIIASLSKSLTLEFGKRFGKTNLYQFYSFYKCYPDIFRSPIGKLDQLLSWTHYYILLTVLDPKAREWYENECRSQNWSVRVLRRSIESQYYFRIVKPGEPIKKEDYPAVSYEENKEQFAKNPMVFEFLGIPQDAKIHEDKLESAIIDHLKESLLELGKGYAFVGRQYHVATANRGSSPNGAYASKVLGMPVPKTSLIPNFEVLNPKNGDVFVFIQVHVMASINLPLYFWVPRPLWHIRGARRWINTHNTTII